MMRAGQDAADPQVALWRFQNLRRVQLRRGPLDEAAANMRKAARLTAKIPAWMNVLFGSALLGKCHVLQGRLDSARVVIGEALLIMQVKKLRSAFDQVEAPTALATINLAIDLGAARSFQPIKSLSRRSNRLP